MTDDHPRLVADDRERQAADSLQRADAPREIVDLLSGDDLECIEAGGAHEWEPVEIARTALHHRQEAMDARDEVERLREALRRLLMDGVQECDPWSGHCDCSTFTARALIGGHSGSSDGARSGCRTARHRLRPVLRWARWRWHRLRWRGRSATWFAIHTYGCDACEAHDA